jgi:hypothetical protein
VHGRNSSNRCTAGVLAQGSFSPVIVSMNGVAQSPGSSSIVGRMLTNQSMPSGRVNSQLMQRGQK